MKNQYLSIVALLCSAVLAFAQEEQIKQEDYYELSLEELMNIPINSASKKDETLFDAPLSSYSITKSDIEKSGATSIMEAMRLAPGVIVRELANGMYDIHIRGLENLTRTNGTFLKTNSYTLVMIDNRPAFNHGLGGTNWESLPVDLNDVERIEIVRGPSSPLFGPNAVTGVINIITKRLSDSNTLANVNVQAGTLGTAIANATVGKKLNDQLSLLVSGNFQDRQRVDEDYYNAGTGTYVPLSTLIPNQAMRDERYPDPNRSLSKWGANAYLSYKASENITADLSLSHQQAQFQKIFVTNPLNDGETKNTAANLSLGVHDLKIRTSYLSGYNVDLRATIPRSEYDYTVADINAEYDIKLNDKYTLTPGVSYQTVTFDDRDYIDPANGIIGLFNDENTINTFAGFLRSDLNFTDKLRVLAGIRVDKFSAPDDAYLAYELAATYDLNAKNLVRAAITRSNSGSFMGYNHLNIGGGQVGDDNLDLLTVDMIELGFRSKLTNNVQLDIDVFQQDVKNLTAILQVSPTQQKFSNVPTTAKQLGTTISVNIVPNDKIQFKPFITLQRTETENLPSIFLDPTLPSPPFPAVSYSSSTHKYTPGSYGGFYFNYRPITKANVNVSGYYLGKQTHYDESYDVEDSSTAHYANGQIEGKFIISAKASYEVVKNLNVFINARNLFGANAREFYAADRTAGLYTGGLSYNLK